MTATHPSLCRLCISKQTYSMMLTGYSINARCDGCGKVADLALVKLTDQLQKTATADVLLVRATLTVRGLPHTWDFDWNDRESVRRFAADSDRCIRAGGSTKLEGV